MSMNRRNVVFGLFFMVFFGWCASISLAQVNIPSQHGQIWKQYDISGYTGRFPQVSQPEKTIADWILMETGFEVWHSDVPAMLNVTRNSVNVYHVPEVHVQVENVIQRFVNINPIDHQFRVHIFTVNSPYWRQKVGNRLIPIPSFSMGSQAWIVPPEEMQAVLEIFQGWSGYVNHASEAKAVPNGQRLELNWVRTRNYTRNFFTSPGSGKSPEAENVLLDDGFSFEFMPLLGVDGVTLDAQIKFQVNHVDRFLPMSIVPAGASGRSTEKIEVPMIGQFRFRERYRWNAENALLVSPGLTPPLTSSGEGSGMSLFNSTHRVETLILVEVRKNYE